MPAIQLKTEISDLDASKAGDQVATEIEIDKADGDDHNPFSDRNNHYQYDDYFTSQVGRKKSVTVKQQRQNTMAPRHDLLANQNNLLNHISANNQN